MVSIRRPEGLIRVGEDVEKQKLEPLYTDDNECKMVQL